MIYAQGNFKKHIAILLITFFSTTALISQNNTGIETSNFWNNVRFGGGLGISSGNNFFSATLAPSAIYDFNDQLALGFSLNGTYNKNKKFYKSTIFGGSIITLFNPIEALQLSTEFEELHVNRRFYNGIYDTENYWYPALFIGVGYTSENLTIGIRYDLLYDDYKSVYAEAWAPFVRFYF